MLLALALLLADAHTKLPAERLTSRDSAVTAI